jgi:hypothetical protein
VRLIVAAHRTQQCLPEILAGKDKRATARGALGRGWARIAHDG